MAHIWERRAGAYRPPAPPAPPSLSDNPAFLHFSVSSGDPLEMSWTQKSAQGEDNIVYKCSTSKGVSIITCEKGGGEKRGVARIAWNGFELGRMLVRFEGGEEVHLEEFLKFVKDLGLEHKFQAKDKELHGSFAADRFMLTDREDNLLGQDTRTPSGLLRRPQPSSFDVLSSLSDYLDYIFVAYMCMERARRERSAGVQSRAYSQPAVGGAGLGNAGGWVMTAG